LINKSHKMNYLLTILNTPEGDIEFLNQFNRYMSPILERDSTYVQYETGVMLYHFETKLDKLGLNDYLIGLNETFGLVYLLSQFNQYSAMCLPKDSLEQLIQFGPKIEDEDHPYLTEDSSEDFDDIIPEDDSIDWDDVAHKLMKKFTFKEHEPTIDEILEKIYEHGIDSLSVQEIAILKSI
jgi:hypothetical protein